MAAVEVPEIMRRSRAELKDEEPCGFMQHGSTAGPAGQCIRKRHLGSVTPNTYITLFKQKGGPDFGGVFHSPAQLQVLLSDVSLKL